MSPERYRLAGELFDRLRDLSDNAASAYLQAEAADDPELVAAVQNLLRGDRLAANGSFLAGRAVDDAARLLDLPSDLPEPGTMIGGYRLLRRIGAGGMGVVYEAQDQRLNRRVAVKVLPQPQGPGSSDRIGRFEQEARAASLLNHPHIVAIYDFGLDQGRYFLAMELVEGATVRQHLNENPRGLERKLILDWISQTASALSGAHQAGMVHRDIKPDNLMIRPDGFLKVLDFGLAKLRDPGTGLSNPAYLSSPGQLSGTIRYLSPEQVAGKRADARRTATLEVEGGWSLDNL